MKAWIAGYMKAQRAAHESIPLEAVGKLIATFAARADGRSADFCFWERRQRGQRLSLRHRFGQGASDKLGKRFRILALNDNVSWLTALANDYAYDEIFAGPLRNYGKPGDIAFGISVSGNSPNCVKAMEWAKGNGLQTIAVVGAKRGRMAELADQAIVINDVHYGRVEDAQMTICHLLCYAFMENPALGRT
ncbi:MAG TPA: SIS domain-containing protein [Verrucomicrobiae bacterium]|nr:SIS domain-containing protein [Verrucomicrobiae bacterium]